jgi:hypothetical protein
MSGACGYEKIEFVLNALIAGREELCCFAERCIADDAPRSPGGRRPATTALSLVQGKADATILDATLGRSRVARSLIN